MAKIGILVPSESMRIEAAELLKKLPLDVVYLRAIDTADTINEARRAVEAGAQLIIARGYQAKLLKEHTHIPLVEIRFTTQEVGLLLQKAREIVRKPHPHIAIIAFENMLPDMTHMASLMDVELSVSYIEKTELSGGVLEEYEKNRPDLVIGGEVTCSAARDRGYMTLFYQATPESIADALRTAERMSFAMDTEQRHAALFETVLDTSFNAILQINASRSVISANHTAEDLLQAGKDTLLGRPVEEVLSGANLRPLEKILDGTQESMATSMEISGESYMVLISSIRFEGQITGAVLSFRQLSAVSSLSRQARRELLLSGHQTSTSFRDLHTHDTRMQRVFDLAKVFALSDSPVLLYEEEGNEAALIASAIHNNSPRKAGPFVSLDVRDLAPAEQVDALLHRAETQDPAASLAEPAVAEGSSDRAMLIRGALIRANHGTLFINRVEKLTLQAQHQLLRTVLPWSQMRTDARSVDALDVRIIACSKHNLLPAVDADAFSEELYYHFSGLTLSIPALESRPADLQDAFRSCTEKYTSKYSRHMTLTQEGLRLVPQLRWPGGLAQVDAFCERLVLSSAKRRLDEQMIRDLFNTLYPEVRNVQGEQRLVVYDAPQAQQLRDLLKKHDGDRAAVAQELGISKTTLWRHMKKYNVTIKF